MTSILMVARAARRRQGRGLVAIALVIGISGAAVLVAVAASIGALVVVNVIGAIGAAAAVRDDPANVLAAE